ncbi:SsrA-binding protein SmpB [uncultured Salinisphaera sp.]|uniref:SsrA-binding protein SmpB n=1 Tax=uncultured Salinisphaera sp. TaxID=359372 RepID=UPI0032B2EE5B|tara:strand:+ start:2772 stop:3254 length:483 start_codon:yes stop_codon:yes gene_type:complete
MSKAKDNKTSGGSTIALNRRARHDYFLEDKFEAGLVLEGWEVKSLRAGKGRVAEAYVLMKDGEAFLLGSHIQPLESASTHVLADATRTRKLLLHERELASLIGATEQKGYTIVPTAMYWRRGKAKLEIALAKGKAKYDKRQTKKTQDWQRRKAQIMRSDG